MEYIVFGAVVLVVVVLIFGKGLYDEHQDYKKFLNKLRNHYGELERKEYRPEQYASIASYSTHHPEEDQVDDITWNDLNMDEIFQGMDDTLSSAGQEVLYHVLRTPCFSEEELNHFEELVQYFTEHTEERVKVQFLLKRLGFTGRFSLYEYLEHLDILGIRSNLKHYVGNFLYFPFLICCFFYPSVGVSGLILCMLYNIFVYFKEKSEIDPYITSFSYVMRLVDISGKMAAVLPPEIEEEAEELRKHRKRLGKFKRGAFWLMSSGRMSGSGNPLDIFLDYARMIFHLDLIKFNTMLEQVRNCTEDVDVLFYTTGYLETAIVVGAYRKSLSEGYCVPVLRREKTEVYLAAKEVYHPLIVHPVKNSVTAKRGVLLTGSNASGKSTFLKTVAINAIFAQTIHTALADSYEGSYFHICTSMALRDDLVGGESYYIVEIRSLKRILNQAAEGKAVLCFVDEVLRGTNTVERISASTEILRSLTAKNVLCFAATHDVELTELLGADYDNYHFEEEIVDGDVRFQYRLLEGKATTRNAIKLLGVMGYEECIIKNAEERAERFLTTGQWR